MRNGGENARAFLLAILGCALVAFCSPWCVGETVETNCLSYEPSLVTLRGVLVRKAFPGPSNYQSVHNRDRPETYWLIKLAEPICVVEDPREPDLNSAHQGIRVVQLVVEPNIYKEDAALVCKRVVATGTLFGAISGHHHTPVLLSVKTLAGAQ